MKFLSSIYCNLIEIVTQIDSKNLINPCDNSNDLQGNKSRNCNKKKEKKRYQKQTSEKKERKREKNNEREKERNRSFFPPINKGTTDRQSQKRMVSNPCEERACMDTIC